MRCKPSGTVESPVQHFPELQPSYIIYFYVFIFLNVLCGSAVFLILAASKLPITDLNKV